MQHALNSTLVSFATISSQFDLQHGTPWQRSLTTATINQTSYFSRTIHVTIIDPCYQFLSRLILETSNLITAVFLALAAHYVFNLQLYHNRRFLDVSTGESAWNTVETRN